MIVYFDTSAVVPLLIDEPTTRLCTRLWDEATRVVSVRVMYPETLAALARAERLGRLTSRQLARAVAELDMLMTEIDVVELGAPIAHAAGELAQLHALRGYDAVHLAAALALADDDLVLVTGDVELATAAQAAGLATSLTTP